MSGNITAILATGAIDHRAETISANVARIFRSVTIINKYFVRTYAPQYKTVASRIDMFILDVPSVCNYQVANYVADAGFYRVGRWDHIVCFCCGVGVKGWSDNVVNIMQLHGVHVESTL